MPNARGDLSPELVIPALKKVLESRTFSTAPKMAKLLRFCVEESVAGRSQSQPALAEVLGYRDFDPLQHSNVRREIGRLRNKLRDYYDWEGAGDLLIISIPKASTKDGYFAKFGQRHEVTGESHSPRFLQLISEARHLWGKRAPEAVMEAIQLYEEAAREDPRHAAKAQVGLAESYAFLTLCGFPAHDTLPKARDWATKATVSDPTNGTAYAILGFAAGAYDWNWVRADELFQKALALAPGATEVRCWYASHLICTSRFSEAIRQAQEAQTLEHEPSAAVLSHVAKVLHAAGDLDHGFDLLQLTLQIAPSFSFGHELLGLLLMDRGDHDVGLAHLQKAVELGPESTSPLASLGYGLAVLGRQQESFDCLRTLEAIRKERYVSAADFATVFAGQNDLDAAFGALEQAINEKCIYLTWLHAWPPFRRLKNDPRFAEMMQRLGLRSGDIPQPVGQRL